GFSIAALVIKVLLGVPVVPPDEYVRGFRDGLAEFLGRMTGATLLGACIGVLIAWVEAVYRKYFLKVTYGPGEMRDVNLGDAPVSIGSDSKICAIWVARAQPVDCTFTLRNQVLTFHDRITGRDQPVEPGFVRKVDNVEVLVCDAAQS